MNYKPNPLLYGACENFSSNFKLVITLRSEVNHAALSRAVEKAMVRYPYFSVSPEKEGDCIWLRPNSRPVPVFDDDRRVVLGTEQACGHLLTFGCQENKIFLNASHYIADGMGIEPVWKTVLYFYVSELYGTDGLNTQKIQLPDAPVCAEEYEYPFPDRPVNIDTQYLPKNAPDSVYKLDPTVFDDKGSYAYHLHIPQRAMMAMANPSDGSPVSFLSVMLYRAICSLDSNVLLPVVAHVQHQYRAALEAPLSRHSMVCYIPISLSPKATEWSVMQHNTVVRGQILLGSEAAADMRAVNNMLEAFPQNATLSEKQQAMRKFVDDSICRKTFGVSYVGKTDWCGFEQYVTDIHAYIGEKNTPNMLLMEIMTIGDDFTINFMQSGRGDRYVKAFMEQLQAFDIPVRMIGEQRYTLCDVKIPE